MLDGLRDHAAQGKVLTMTGASDLAQRIEDACRRAAEPDEERRMPAQMEDLLAEGYIEALRGEARSRRLAERLAALMETLDAPGAAVEARALVRERHLVEARVRELRVRLRVLRDHLARLGGEQPACAAD